MGTTIGRHRISKQYSHVVLNPVPYNKSESYLRKKWCVYRTKDMGDLDIGRPEPPKAIYDNTTDCSVDTGYSGLREDEALGMECANKLITPNHGEKYWGFFMPLFPPGTSPYTSESLPLVQIYSDKSNYSFISN